MVVELKSWIFKLDVPTDSETDAHRTLVNWLRKRELSHLFDADNKSIGYVIQHEGNKSVLIARSSKEILDPIVQESSTVVDISKEQTIAILVPSSKLVRPPKLKYEVSKSKRTKNYVRQRTQDELRAIGVDLAAECGLSESMNILDIIQARGIEIYHKQQQLRIEESAALLLMRGVIQDQDRFIHAWENGVGSKRVYGFGMVRVL
jgi:carbamoylphosphate synthase small subunit